MNKFVLLALVAVFAVAAAQEIADVKLAPLNRTNRSIFANKTGLITVTGHSKNITHRPKLMAGFAHKNFSNYLNAKLPNFSRPNRTFVLPTNVVRPNKTFIGRPIRTNKTNKTSKAGGLFGRGGFQDEESSESSFFTDDDVVEYISAVKAPMHPRNKTTFDHKNRTKNSTTGFFGRMKNWFSKGNQQEEDEEVEYEVVAEDIEDFFAGRNRTFPGRPNKSGKTNRTGKVNRTSKAGKGGLFDRIASWFFEVEQEDEEEELVFDEELEDYVALKGGQSKYFSKKWNETRKPVPPKKNSSAIAKNKTSQPQKRNITHPSKNSTKIQPPKKNTTKIQPNKKNTTVKVNGLKPLQKNSTKKTNQSQKKNVTKNVTKPTQKNNTQNKTNQPQKKNITKNVTKPIQKNNSQNKTQPKKNMTKKNETKKIHKFE